MKLASNLVLVVPAILVAFTMSAGEGPKQAPPGWPTLAPGEVQLYPYPPECYFGNCGDYGMWGNCAPRGGKIEECIGSCDSSADCLGGPEKCTCEGDPPFMNDAYQSARARGLSGSDRVEIVNCKGEDDWMSFENLERVVLRQARVADPFGRKLIDNSARASGKPVGRAVDRATNPARNAMPRGTPSGGREADPTR